MKWIKSHFALGRYVMADGMATVWFFAVRGMGWVFRIALERK